MPTIVPTPVDPPTRAAVTSTAIRARGSADCPVSLRYKQGALGLWSHNDGAFVDLANPPQGVTVWVELPFEELPPKAQEYVRIISRIDYAREYGSGGQYLSQLQDEAASLLRDIQHEHTSTLRNNVLLQPSVQSKLHAVRTGGMNFTRGVPT